MKQFAAAAVLVAIVLLLASTHDKVAGAAPAQGAQPLVSGEFLSGTLWDKPVGALGSNTGHSPAAGARLDVYDNFIVVTDAEGISELSLHGSYTKLRFKPYRP